MTLLQTQTQVPLTPRERELGAIILQYNEVTERLKTSHEQLLSEVGRLREELEHKNRQLERRERLAALGQMAAGLAHEIRNPLGGIQLYADLLTRDLTESPAQLKVVEKIRCGVRRLETLVSDVLSFAHPSEPQRCEVLVHELVEEVGELVSPQLHQHRVELRADEQCRTIALCVDPRHIQQILMNLLLNGIEAAGDGGWVEVAARIVESDETGSDVVLTVGDSGPGVPPDIRERIFNPFFTTRETGTGLGLAIVHQLVEAHGGSVSVGRHPQGGALFMVRLPMRSPQEVSRSMARG